ncbi:MAG: tetratricopeptide repeat protein [Bacteroidetes bacterium]|jgi:tetratricopeptide (TPR) repeat protein|nr:tetratricopeptide repeat protein [Bacteroidota bacterium]
MISPLSQVARFILLVFFLQMGCVSGVRAQADAEEKLAHAYYLDGTYEKAIPIYERLHKKSPLDFEVLKRLTDSYVKTGAGDEALVALRKAQRKDPRAVVVALESQVLAQLGKTQEADSRMKDAIAACRNEAEYRMLGSYLLANQQYEAAEATYVAASGAAGVADRFALELSYVYRYKNDYLAATKALIDYYRAQPEQASMVRSQLLGMAETAAYQKDIETGIIQRMAKLPEDRQLPEWLYDFYVQTEHYEAALRQARALDRQLQEQGKRLYELGVILQQNEQYLLSNEAFATITTAQRQNPYYVQALGEQAKNLELIAFASKPLDTTALRKAVQNYDALLLRYGRNPQMRELLYRKARLCAFYLQEPEVALQELAVIEQLPIAPSDKATARLLLGDVLLLQGERLKAEIQYKKVLEDFKEDQVGAQARYRQARLQYFTGRFADAQAYLKVLKERPENDIANDAIRLYLTIQDNTGLDTGTVALEQFAQAELLAYQHQDAAALQLLDSILLGFPGHALEDDIYFTKSSIYLNMGKLEEAIRYLDRLLQQFPQSVRADEALFTKADLYQFQLKDAETARKLYLDLLVQYPASLYKVEARKRIRAMPGNP